MHELRRDEQILNRQPTVAAIAAAAIQLPFLSPKLPPVVMSDAKSKEERKKKEEGKKRRRRKKEGMIRNGEKRQRKIPKSCRWRLDIALHSSFLC